MDGFGCDRHEEGTEAVDFGKRLTSILYDLVYVLVF